eukprot:COSAG06_NODE_56180_length_286_cov_0.652406_1_plen_28_part_01
MKIELRQQRQNVLRSWLRNQHLSRRQQR